MTSERPRRIGGFYLALVLAPVMALALVFAWSAQAQARESASIGAQIRGSSFFAALSEDVEAASDWYQAAFGLAEISRIDAPDGRFAIRILSLSNEDPPATLTVELIQRRDASQRTGLAQGWFKVGFYVADIDEAHRRLRALEIDTDDAIFVDSKLQARSFVFRDLDGNRLQVFERCGQPCG